MSTDIEKLEDQPSGPKLECLNTIMVIRGTPKILGMTLRIRSPTWNFWK